MRARVIMLNVQMPTAQAVTSNEIAIAFTPPLDGSISLSDQLEVDLNVLDTEQDVLNLTSGERLRLRISTLNVHDLRLPGGHGTSRFPSLERRNGA